MKNVLIFSTNDGHALRIMRCLSILKIRVCVMGNGKSRSITSSRYCGNYYMYESKDLEEEYIYDLLEKNGNIINDINNYCKQHKIDIIIPAGIGATLFLSKIGKEITDAKVFPLKDLGTIKMLNNKWTFTEFMNKNRLPCPKTILISDVCQIRSLDLEFPVIIKPLESKGGIGVVKLNSFKELETYMSSDNRFNKPPLIIQDYVPGIDVDISILAKDGKMVAHTIQIWESKSVIKFIKDDKIADIGRHFVSCCDYNGVAHIDMRFDNRDQSVKIVECNPRFWGSVETSMLSGVNFPYLGILIAHDEKLPKDIGYRDIKYIMPDMIIFEILRNMSLKDIVTGHNLYFVQKIIYDPLYYCYFIPVLFSKIFMGLTHKLRYMIDTKVKIMMQGNSIYKVDIRHY